MDANVARRGWEAAAGGAVRVACLADAATTADVADALAAWLPGAVVVQGAPPEVRGLPDADGVVLGAADDGRPELARLRALRAGGFAGAVVLLAGAAPAPDEKETRELARLGGVVAALEGPAADAALAEAVVEALGRGAPAEGASPLRAALGATRQRLAAAEVALRLQHSLNNPLAGLMAEAQLLELEELPSEGTAAVRRMVELCRRLAAIVRELDVVRAPAAPAGPAAPAAVAAVERGGA